MSFGPEDFAKHLFPRSTRRVPVYATLLKHPNLGITAEEINKELDLETDKATIDETQRVLREIKDCIETCRRKNPRGPPINVYKPGKLLEDYRSPLLPHTTLGKGREEYLDYHIRAYVVDTREEIDRLGIGDLEERASKGDQPALNRLIQMLSSEVRDEHSHGYIKVDVGMQAAISLGNIGEPKAAPVLRKASSDPAAEIRDAAREALEKIEKGI